MCRISACATWRGREIHVGKTHIGRISAGVAVPLMLPPWRRSARGEIRSFMDRLLAGLASARTANDVLCGRRAYLGRTGERERILLNEMTGCLVGPERSWRAEWENEDRFDRSQGAWQACAAKKRANRDRFPLAQQISLPDWLPASA